MGKTWPCSNDSEKEPVEGTVGRLNSKEVEGDVTQEVGTQDHSLQQNQSHSTRKAKMGVGTVVLGGEFSSEHFSLSNKGKVIY